MHVQSNPKSSQVIHEQPPSKSSLGSPSNPAAMHILQLQKTIGNRAVVQMLQNRNKSVQTSTAKSPIQRMSEEDYTDLQKRWGLDTVTQSLGRLNKTWQEAEFDDVNDDIYDATKSWDPNKEIVHASSADSFFPRWLEYDTKPTQMNCWEYVIFTAIQAGALTKEEVKRNFFDEDTGEMKDDDLISVFSTGELMEDIEPENFSVGDAIIISQPQRHVLLSLGGETVADLGSWTRVNITTIGEVIRSQSNNVEMTRSHIDNLIREYINEIDAEVQSGDLSSEQEQTKMDVMDKLYEVRTAVQEYDPGNGGVQALESFVLADSLNKQIPFDIVSEVLNEVKKATRIQIYKIPRNEWIGKIKAGIE